MKTTLVIPALLLLAASAAAQTTPAPTKDPISSALRDILPGRRKNTVAAVEAMPAEKFNYKPTADQMTFGHLVGHIAETNDLLYSKAAAVPAPKVDEVKETESKDKLVAALKASFDFCSDALAKMEDSRLAVLPGFGSRGPRASHGSRCTRQDRPASLTEACIRALESPESLVEPKLVASAAECQSVKPGLATVRSGIRAPRPSHTRLLHIDQKPQRDRHGPEKGLRGSWPDW
jgi:DinB family protein